LTYEYVTYIVVSIWTIFVFCVSVIVFIDVNVISH